MLVVFEGIDGSGKTTVSNRVAKRLKESGLRVKHLRAGGQFASSVTEAIRALGRDSRNLALVPEAEFLLYVARDVQLLEEALRPALEDHDVVIADRFFYTADALARFGRGLTREQTAPVLSVATRGIEPDIVVLVDVDPKLARARRKAAKIASVETKAPSRKGQGGVGLQHRLRDGYRYMAAQAPHQWVVLDNTEGLDSSVTRITRLIDAARQSGASRAIDRFSTSPRGEADAPTNPISPEAALESLLAWVDRRAELEPGVAAYMLSGLFGPGVDERRWRLMEQAPEGVLAALSGLDDPVSWQIREALAETYPVAAIKSLSSVMDGSHERATRLRRSHAAAAPDAVIRSLAGVDDELSWSLRDRYRGTHPDAVVSSLRRIDTSRAWALRESWFEEAGPAVDTDYEAARVAAQSVAGLDTDRAWGIRKRARVAAPINAIASLKPLVSDRSWRMRERYLVRAPKAVMATLAGVDCSRAWGMRRVVAETCKEALDGIRGMNCSEAWELRDSMQDVWPSTVAKSLGPLADEPRGNSLLLRQLDRYRHDLSLLQHAAAVALGVHRVSVDAE